MNLKDILDLAKAGYKPSDVKELIELSKSAAAPSTGESDIPTDADKPDTTGVAEATKEVNKEDDSKPVADDKEVDYKKVLAEMQEKLKASEDALKKLQDDNSRVRIAEQPEESSIDVFNNAMRNFM